MIPHKQLSLGDFFTDCQNIFENDKPAFLSLLENHIDLDEIIPASFYSHFYASTGRTRKYPLKAMLWSLIIQRIFLSQLTSFCLLSSITPDPSVSSAVSPKSLMLPRSHVLSRSSCRTYNRSLITSLISPNRFARPSTPPKPI